MLRSCLGHACERQVHMQTTPTQLVFADASCIHNGKTNARAGYVSTLIFTLHALRTTLISPLNNNACRFSLHFHQKPDSNVIQLGIRGKQSNNRAHLSALLHAYEVCSCPCMYSLALNQTLLQICYKFVGEQTFIIYSCSKLTVRSSHYVCCSWLNSVTNMHFTPGRWGA